MAQPQQQIGYTYLPGTNGVCPSKLTFGSAFLALIASKSRWITADSIDQLGPLNPSRQSVVFGVHDKWPMVQIALGSGVANNPLRDSREKVGTISTLQLRAGNLISVDDEVR